MRTDECSLDIGSFVFVFHVVEGRQNRLLQRLLVIGNENVINALFFLQSGSASMLAFRIDKGVLHELLQFSIFNSLNLFGPFCLLVKCIRYTCFHKFFDYSFGTLTYVGNLFGS